MKSKTFALATALTFAVSGAAMAQTPSGGGSAEGNMNNPGSVKSNSDKAMEKSTGSATGNTTGSTETGMAPAAPSAASGSTGGSMGAGSGSAGGPAGGR